jgi:hypothetical protein
MRRHRILTLAGAGSAVAACIAIWAILFVPTPATTVEAATIFASFREAVGNAFELQFSDLGDDGVLVDGRVIVLFEGTEKGATPFESAPQGVYVEAKVETDEEADADVAGLNVEVVATLMPGQEWVFLKLKNLPTKVIKEEPMAAIVTQIAKDGVLLDLDGIMEKEFGAELDELRFDEIIGLPGLEAGGEADEVQQLLGRLLTGKATGEEFVALVSQIEEEVAELSVTETEPGLHVLTASGFDFEDDAEAKRMAGSMILKIAYREGVGIAWATIEHIGAYDGTVRFEMIDLAAEDELFDRKRFLKEGAVQRFDVSQFLDLVGAMEDDGES